MLTTINGHSENALGLLSVFGFGCCWLLMATVIMLLWFHNGQEERYNSLLTGVAQLSKVDVFSGISVCLSVCQYDNFRTIKRRMMKLVGSVHCTKISPEFNLGVIGPAPRSLHPKLMCFAESLCKTWGITVNK